MRVEGQGKAVDYSPAEFQSGGRTAVAEVKEAIKETKEKIGLSSLVSFKDDARKLEEAAKVLNDAMKFANCRLEFQPYEDSGRYQVKVVDSSTNDVIKEIPPDYMLEFSIKIKDMINEIVGLFVDEKA